MNTTGHSGAELRRKTLPKGMTPQPGCKRLNHPFGNVTSSKPFGVTRAGSDHSEANIAMNQPLQVLIVEESEAEAQVLLSQLQQGGYEPRWQRVDNPAAVKAALAEQEWEVIIADFWLPHFSGLDALRLVQAAGRDIPLILVSGAIGEEQAANAIKAGVHGYLLKDRLAQLAGVVKDELRKAGLRRLTRQTEAALRASEERFRLATAAAHAMVYDVDAVTYRVNALHGVRELLGYASTPSELTLDWWDQQIHPEDLARCHEAFQQIRNTGHEHTLHYRLRHQDGRIIHAEDNATAVRDSAGKLVRIVGTVVDITARKRAEAALRESEARFATIFKDSPSPIGLCRLKDGIFLDVNEPFARLYGYSRQELIGHSSEELGLWHSNRDQVIAELQSKKRLIVDIQARCKNGEIRDLLAALRLTEFGGEPCILGTLVDVTDRKRAETALRESEERYALAVAGSNDALWDWNILSGEEIISDRGWNMLGYQPGELPSQMNTWRGLIHPEDLEMVDHQMAAHLERRTPCNIEFRMLTKQRGYRWVHVRGQAVWNTQGQPYRMAGSVSDISERKRAEDEIRQLNEGLEQRIRERTTALQESEERFRMMVEGVKDYSIILLDLTGRVTSWNTGAAQIKGYEADEIIGQHFSRFYTVNDIAGGRPEQHLQAAAAEGRYVGEGIRVRKNGSEFFSSVVITALSDEARRLRGYVKITRDISERKRAETELRLFRTLIDHAKNNIFVLDFATTRFLDANASGCADLGYSRDELLKMTAAEVTNGLERAHIDITNARLKETGYAKTEAWHRRKDGTTYPVEVNLSLVKLDREYVISIVQDITERKRAEEYQMRMATIFEQATESIMITDTQCRILYVNPAFEKTTGYALVEVVGQNPRILRSGRHDTEFFRQMWAVLNRGATWSGHLINRRKDGTLFEEAATISPVRDTANRIINYVAIKRDVTYEVELEGQLRQSQKMEAIGTLAGGIAHDFNNILSAIYGYSYLLRLELAGQNEALEKVGEILKAGERAKDLVQQILAFSRQREQERRVMHLQSPIKEATKLLRASLPANIQLEIRLAEDAPTVLADATQIYQVAMNLGTNALHAMEKQAAGKLAITLDLVEPDAMLRKAHPELQAIQYARLTVTDTGCGMDPRTLARIYEPFFTTKPVGKGTGLGLAVVHGIVKAQDGVITVESQPGRGTTFRLYFPEHKQNRVVEVIPEAGAIGGIGQKILIVDDEAALTRTYHKLLAELNYESTTTSNPKEAVRLVRINPAQFDLVITDLTMPELNGLEVARQIREIRADLPVILMTGFQGTVTNQQIQEAGICKVVEKPVALPRLAVILRDILG